MTYRGHIRNGQITLDEPAALPEGAEVGIEIIHNGQHGENGQSVLADIARLADRADLRRDYSQQHDHYVKGTPRK
jgi:hypothetical protein